MTRFITRVSAFAILFAGATISLLAAPQLMLRMPANDPLDRAVWVASGSNGPSDLEFYAYNVGDGSLDVQVSGSAPWLTPQVDAAAPCPFDGGVTCRRVRVLFSTGALADGTYEASVVVTATAAIDAPQTVPVKIYVGGNVPDEIHLYVPPTNGASDFVRFQTPGQDEMDPTSVTPAGAFLSVSASHNGSFREVYDHHITGSFQSGASVGDQGGSVTVSGSVFGADNGTVPVTLHVTNSPIGQLSTSHARLLATDGLPPADYVFSVGNRGSGSLAVSTSEVATDDAGTWLEAVNLGNNAYALRATPDGLPPGQYGATVTINSNAANSPHRLRVTLQLAPRGGPLSYYRGAVNGANFEASRPLAPGVIASAFGEQLSDSVATAQVLPLPTEMSGVKVLVDGVEAPLFFVSYGQVNFQVPYATGPGQKLVQVMRDGQMGNQISVQVEPFSAGIFRLGIGEYGAIINASKGNFPYPVAFGQQNGINASPAQPGDILEIYATGVGPVSRAVGDGEAPGGSPLAVATTQNIKVRFSDNLLSIGQTPQFVGLSPQFVGLFQINVPVPPSASPNPKTPVLLDIPTKGLSNRVEIAVQ